MANLKLMTIGEMTLDKDCDIPVLEVLVDGEIYGYLTPFRGYHFQVSKTYEGKMDLGTSINYTYGKSLKQCIRNTNTEDYIYGTDKSVFAQLAVTAINESARYCQINNNDCNVAVVCPSLDTEFNRFIEESIKWVLKRG